VLAVIGRMDQSPRITRKVRVIGRLRIERKSLCNRAFLPESERMREPDKVSGEILRDKAVIFGSLTAKGELFRD
jgi:hypothetical protein